MDFKSQVPLIVSTLLILATLYYLAREVAQLKEKAQPQAQPQAQTVELPAPPP